MHQLFPQFFSEANAKGARSTALHSLQWAMGMLLCSLPISLWANAPTWLLIVLAIALGLMLITFLVAYIFLLGRNPDALRSENFTLSKMAIEHGLMGDSQSGFRTINSKNSSPENLIADKGENK